MVIENSEIDDTQRGEGLGEKRGGKRERERERDGGKREKEEKIFIFLFFQNEILFLRILNHNFDI